MSSKLILPKYNDVMRIMARKVVNVAERNMGQYKYKIFIKY